jgi:hypothetical protein
MGQVWVAVAVGRLAEVMAEVIWLNNDTYKANEKKSNFFFAKGPNYLYLIVLKVSKFWTKKNKKFD